MSPEYTKLTPQQVGHQAANLNVSGSPEALMQFVLWAQRSALADHAKREMALTELMRLSEEMGAYDLPEAAK